MWLALDVSVDPEVVDVALHSSWQMPIVTTPAYIRCMVCASRARRVLDATVQLPLRVRRQHQLNPRKANVLGLLPFPRAPGVLNLVMQPRKKIDNNRQKSERQSTMAATPLGIGGAVGDFSHSVVIRKNTSRRSYLGLQRLRWKIRVGPY
jgi:hypothetical protein